jgi:dihydroorotate dehydrogenase electron transfer subunit
MFQQDARILWNESVAADIYRIGLKCGLGYRRTRPGQFVMVRVADAVEPLLRRPFSIHRLIVSNGRCEGIELLYKVVGRGTRQLSRCRPDQTLNVLGPLGSAFLIPPATRRVFIVAGGMGVAPMTFLAAYLLEQGIHAADCTVFLGGRTRSDLLCESHFKELNLAVHTTTDDGSAGDRCLVTHPVEAALKRRRPDIVYACGPLPMLHCLVGITEKHAVVCQVSIETAMACGLGACLGCAVAARDRPGKYYHACLDGPVFDTRSLSLIA